MSLIWSDKDQCLVVPPGKRPYPIHGDNGSAADCVRKGHCGCDEAGKKEARSPIQQQEGE